MVAASLPSALYYERWQEWTRHSRVPSGAMEADRTTPKWGNKVQRRNELLWTLLRFGQSEPLLSSLRTPISFQRTPCLPLGQMGGAGTAQDHGCRLSLNVSREKSPLRNCSEVGPDVTAD
ncbi:uncharacterized protein ACBT57_025441 isoform 2-T3 [Dama dama]